MPPKKSITLTEAELRLMKILWARGESAVGDLVAAMPDGAGLCAAPAGGQGIFIQSMRC